MTDETTIENLTPAQQKALSVLLIDASIRKAATAAGVKDRTIYHWLKQPLFADEYREARREATRQAIARLQQSSAKAVTTLIALMGSTKPDAIRLRAALGVLEYAFRGTEIEELRNELEQLQALVRERMGDEPSDV